MRNSRSASGQAALASWYCCIIGLVAIACCSNWLLSDRDARRIVAQIERLVRATDCGLAGWLRKMAAAGTDVRPQLGRVLADRIFASDNRKILSPRCFPPRHPPTPGILDDCACAMDLSPPRCSLVACCRCHWPLGQFALADDEPKPIAIKLPERKEPVSFAKEVLPILSKNCLACHNAAKNENSLVLETPQVDGQGGRFRAGFGAGQERRKPGPESGRPSGRAADAAR